MMRVAILALAIALVSVAALAGEIISGPARVIGADTLEIAGERIYHVPGGAYYDRTKISPIKGGARSTVPI